MLILPIFIYIKIENNIGKRMPLKFREHKNEKPPHLEAVDTIIKGKFEKAGGYAVAAQAVITAIVASTYNIHLVALFTLFEVFPALYLRDHGDKLIRDGKDRLKNLLRY